MASNINIMEEDTLADIIIDPDDYLTKIIRYGEYDYTENYA